MSKHWQRDLENLNHKLVTLSALVEEMIDKASRALLTRQDALALEVIGMDDQVDAAEVGIEEECLKMLALHQPVAVDLRRVTTVLKANAELERIADLAVSVAERTRALTRQADFPIPEQLKGMVAMASQMVRGALNAFVNLDGRAARHVITLDDEVDQRNVDIIRELQEQMRGRPEWVEPGIHCFSATRHIERIADHATNIAEDVIYLVDGDIVRHKHKQRATSQR